MAAAAQMVAMPNWALRRAISQASQGGDDAAAGGGPGMLDAKDQEPEGTRSFIIDYGDVVLPAFVSDPWRKPLNVSVCRFGAAKDEEPEMTRSLTIDYSDDVLLALRLSPDEFREEAKILIAVKLYEMGRLSTGAAAELANVPKPLFLTKLADYGVDTFDMSKEELQSDLASARRQL